MRLKQTVMLAALLGGLAGPAVAQGDAAAGEKVFARCRACHEVGADAKSKTGPALTGVVGRTAGTYEPFPNRYSDAMLAKRDDGLVWNEQTLSEFLADPRGFIPGNKMTFPGLKKEDERANLIAFLAGQAQ